MDDSTIPDAAMEAALNRWCGGQWTRKAVDKEYLINEMRETLAAAVPHLAPHADVAEPTPDAWIEGDTVAMLRAVVFPGSAAGFISPRWEARLKTAAHRIDDRIAAGPVVGPGPVWTAEMAALLLEVAKRACVSDFGYRLVMPLIEAAFPTPGALARCLSRPPCVTECAEPDRCAHAKENPASVT